LLEIELPEMLNKPERCSASEKARKKFEEGWKERWGVPVTGNSESAGTKQTLRAAFCHFLVSFKVIAKATQEG
jgi:hypothetical protein